MEDIRHTGTIKDKMTYDFMDEGAGDEVNQKKMDSGYVDIPEVCHFNCDNCKWFDNKWCNKMSMMVDATSCCAVWELGKDMTTDDAVDV